MTRASVTRNENEGSRLTKVAKAVGRLFGRGRQETAASAPAPAVTREKVAAPASAARTVRRETDIPLDLLDRSYTPSATSSKQGFRSDGADHQSDQEFAFGTTDERWRDEDRFTNKSGDPRIGTRGRTYEPEEQRNESGD